MKRRTSQRIRKDWIDLSLIVWGKIIVQRDRCCQYKGCGSTDSLCGHHIVPRGVTPGYKICWYDYKNGVALCNRHHAIPHNRNWSNETIHDYTKWIDEWLERRYGFKFDYLRALYRRTGKLHLSEIKIINVGLLIDYGQEVESTVYNRIYKRVMKDIR